MKEFNLEFQYKIHLECYWRMLHFEKSHMYIIHGKFFFFFLYCLGTCLNECEKAPPLVLLWALFAMFGMCVCAAGGSGEPGNAADLEALQKRVRRQETLLQRCKELINTNKERSAQLSSENDALQQQLQERLQELEKMKVKCLITPCSDGTLHY